MSDLEKTPFQNLENQRDFGSESGTNRVKPALEKQNSHPNRDGCIIKTYINRANYSSSISRIRALQFITWLFSVRIAATIRNRIAAITSTTVTEKAE